MGFAAVDQKIDAIREALFAKYPVIFGMTVYQSFESDAVAKSGIVPMPAADEAIVGGHCMVITGYEHGYQLFIVRNSWGMDWGIDGQCLIPYDYLTNPDLADAFFALSLVRQS